MPAVPARDLRITIAALPEGISRSQARFGLGTAAAAGVTMTVSGVPAGGLRLCLPLPPDLVSEAGARPLTLTLVRYENAGWNARPGATRQGTEVCAGGVSGGLFAGGVHPAPARPGPPSGLTATPGDAPRHAVLPT